MAATRVLSLSRPLARSSAIYAVGLLTLVNVFNYMDRMVLAVLAEPIKRDLKLTDSELGLLTGFVFVAVYAAVSLPLARLADRIGRRRVLAGALAVWSGMTALCGMANSFAQLALARAGVGVGEAGGMPSSHALLADIFPAEKRALPIAVMTGGACIGIAGGMALGGVIAGAFGWRRAFVAVGLPGVLLAIVVAMTLPEPRRPDDDPEQRQAQQKPLIPAVRGLLQKPAYRWLVAAHPFFLFATAGLIGWMPPFFIRSHGMSLELVGLFFGLAYGVGTAMGGIVGALVLQRITAGSVSVMLRWAGILFLLSAPLLAGAMLVPGSTAAMGLIALFGMLAGAAGPPMIAGQQGVAVQSNRALASAVSAFCSAYIGAGLGPLLIGMASDAMAPALGADALRYALLLATLAVIPGGVSLIMASRHYDNDAAG